MTARVLVVDDEPSIRKVLAVQLGRHGHDVVAAADGQEAVELLEGGAFDAVITDLKMPRLDGIGLLDWCRTHRPGLPVLVITAFGSVETAVVALKAGAVDYVTKPFDQDELRATLDAVLADHGVQTPAPDGADLDLKEYVRVHTARIERHRIQAALDAEEGNVTHAARRLGISRRSLQTKMKDYGLRED